MMPPSAPAAFVDQVVLEEMALGERLVAWVRAAVWILIGPALLTGLVPARRTLGDEIATGLGACMLAVGVGSLLYAGWLKPARFRRWMGLASVTFDFVVLGAVPVVTALPGATALCSQALGATPALLGMSFVVAAVALRQDPRLCAFSVAYCVVMCGLGALASQHADATLVAEPMRIWLRPQAWALRGVLTGGVAVLLALATRNARRMVRQAATVTAERSRLMGIFGRYVAPEVRDAVVSGETTAVLREVTVLFTDLRDFTALAESVDPATVLGLLNAHFQAMVPIVHRHGGTVNKFVGDALMATFGAPLSQPNHALRATTAALEMLAATDVLNARLAAAGRHRLQMGIGVATGSVVVGTLGAEERSEYAVIGDTVNTAARLESLNKELGTRLLLSEATARAVGAAFPLRPAGSAKVKGKAEPLNVFTAGSATPG